ncbi:hypothetical protein KIN20_025294 [Parelaphostrongylus tenuis]|uniref:Metalloendopeptidase n=1 Tax=Parelaphostrongylus tenuis TaxID=148309 RepID=A0AAD5MV12_PARTN|nr:hypothetical protein KIN20_025294 [Parelaphostrongylus tenuis]
MNVLFVFLFVLSLAKFLSTNFVKRGPLIDIYEQKGGDTKSSPILSPRAFPRGVNNTENTEGGRCDNVVIPFIITGQYEPHEQKLIIAAMNEIAHNTCVRFRQRKHEKDYVNIRNDVEKGCFSSVGMEGGEQILNLEASSKGSCMSFHIIFHELLHAVGLNHEHSRYDRDEYVKVHYENVRKEWRSQFDKCPYPLEYDIPYDYKSIMHYSERAFSKNNGITLETLDPHYQNIIGNVRRPSNNDYLKVCAMYRCATCIGEEVVVEDIPSQPTVTESQLSQVEQDVID